MIDKNITIWYIYANRPAGIAQARKAAHVPALGLEPAYFNNRR